MDAHCPEKVARAARCWVQDEVAGRCVRVRSPDGMPFTSNARRVPLHRKKRISYTEAHKGVTSTQGASDSSSFPSCGRTLKTTLTLAFLSFLPLPFLLALATTLPGVEDIPASVFWNKIKQNKNVTLALDNGGELQDGERGKRPTCIYFKLYHTKR